MQKTLFEITKMDCPSEENLIRMRLDDFHTILHMDFDIPNRQLTVYHEAPSDPILNALTELNLGARQLDTTKMDKVEFNKDTQQKKLLWWVLIINAVFFLLEMTTGLLSKSMGLVADSLDMLADAFVYGISLLAVGRSTKRKKKVAKTAGYFQLLLALLGFFEVVRRFVGKTDLPDFSTMIIVSIFALLANALCLYLLQQSKSKEAHIKASMIFTSNDIIINLGVVMAGILVYYFQSNLPDLIVGSIVFILVLQGALRILKLSK